jgi:gamma-butyrobetaine dioxygenase
VSVQADQLRLNGVDGQDAIYPLIWLRHNCPSAFHPETGERVLDLRDLPEVPALDDVEVGHDRLRLVWEGGHVSDFAMDWLMSHIPGRATSDKADNGIEVWDGSGGATSVPRFAAQPIVSEDAALLDWLRRTRAHGVSIVTDMELTKEAGIAVARRVAFLRETNFGVTFSVENKPDPTNLAYTAEALPLHTDLPNQELPPGYQFLQCIANEAEGGGSVLVDGFAVAESCRAEAPEDFQMLTRVAVPFRYFDNAFDIRAHRPIIDLHHDGRLKEISHSSHLVDVFDMDCATMTAFYPVFRRWLARLEEDRFKVELKLAGGEMMVFDNRRILHGRTSFDPSTGYRLLQGFYVDRQEWDSRIRVLSRA